MGIVFEVPVYEWVRLYVEETDDNQYQLVVFDVERNEVELIKKYGELDEAIKYCKFYQPFVKDFSS